MSVGSAPHSNQTFVSEPFGLTLPFKVALVDVIEVDADVTTVGTGEAVKSTVFWFAFKLEILKGVNA